MRLEHASMEIERQGAEQDPNYRKWLRMLITPGGLTGGARPKARVVDTDGHLWIAKFSSRVQRRCVSSIPHAYAAKGGDGANDAFSSGKGEVGGER